MYFTAKGFAVKISAKKNRLDGLAQLGEGFVGGMLDVVACEAPQDCFRIGGAKAQRSDVRLKDIDLETARLYVRRKKGSLSTHQPIEGDELRAIRAWLRERELRADARSAYLFLSERGPMTRQAFNYLVAEAGKRAKLRFHVHPHMLRHSTGYYLANRNHDTRLIQDYLGHRNIAHTVRYTRTAASRFEGLWR
jgi:type 1 fimbriae regulatory protein FimB